MHIYKVRHKASGLFYKPGNWNSLDTDGKWYKTKHTVKSYLGDGYSETIKIDMDSKLYKKNAEIFNKCVHDGVAEINYNLGTIDFHVIAEDFEIVQYDVELTNEKVIG